MALANISVLIKMILRRLEYVSETEDQSSFVARDEWFK